MKIFANVDFQYFTSKIRNYKNQWFSTTQYESTVNRDQILFLYIFSKIIGFTDNYSEGKIVRFSRQNVPIEVPSSSPRTENLHHKKLTQKVAYRLVFLGMCRYIIFKKLKMANIEIRLFYHRPYKFPTIIWTTFKTYHTNGNMKKKRILNFFKWVVHQKVLERGTFTQSRIFKNFHTIRFVHFLRILKGHDERFAFSSSKCRCIIALTNQYYKYNWALK